MIFQSSKNTLAAMIAAGVMWLAGPAQAQVIIGMADINFETSDGQKFHGQAWNDFKIGRFCAAAADGPTCYGYFPAYWGQDTMSVPFQCTDGRTGQADMRLRDRKFLFWDLLVPYVMTGTIGSGDSATEFSGRIGHTYIDLGAAIACRGPLREMERDQRRGEK